MKDSIIYVSFVATTAIEKPIVNPKQKQANRQRQLLKGLLMMVLMMREGSNDHRRHPSPSDHG